MPSPSKPSVGFVGLGIMGRSMALNIRKAGYPLTVYNRTTEKTRPLVQAGAIAASSPREVAERSEIVIACVTDTPDVEAILFGKDGIAEGARPGTTFIDMSTISPVATRTFAARLAERAVAYLDAPVSGGDVGAIQGTLSIMVGGDAETFERARPILETMGKRIVHVGPIGSGQAAKACNQILCAVNMMGVCEALTLGKASGLDLDVLLSVLTGGAANSWALENLGPRIAHGDLAPGFMIDLIQKDLAIVQQTAAKTNVPLPGTSLAMQNFRAVQAEGNGRLGTQAMIRFYDKMCGK
jgi:3-hydroxyisobutyrate dehydrogenase